MLKFKTSCAVLANLSSNLLNEVSLSLFRYFKVGLRVCDIVVNKFTFAISFPDEFLLLLVFPYFFVSVPCARLSWPSRPLLSARRSTVSYRIVSWRRYCDQRFWDFPSPRIFGVINSSLEVTPLEFQEDLSRCLYGLFPAPFLVS